MTPAGMDSSDPARSALQQRLADELGDADAAATIVAAVDQDTVDRLVRRSGGDLARTDLVSYRPVRVDDDRIDSLWVLAFGYRIAAGQEAADVSIPPMRALEPGPINEALADAVRSFVARHPVPIVAQWEVARVLDDLGVADVISVEPDRASDGSVVYLSTAGVIEKGLRLATVAGIEVGVAGVVGHADYAQRCVRTAAAAGLDAAVPAGIRLPSTYDPESGQPWTRSRADYIPVDLMARAFTD